MAERRVKMTLPDGKTVIDGIEVGIREDPRSGGAILNWTTERRFASK